MVVSYYITMIMDVTQSVPRELIDSARNPARPPRSCRPCHPGKSAGIVTAMRQMLAVSWTYLVIGRDCGRRRRHRRHDDARQALCAHRSGDGRHRHHRRLGGGQRMLVRAAHRLAFSYLYLTRGNDKGLTQKQRGQSSLVAPPLAMLVMALACVGGSILERPAACLISGLTWPCHGLWLITKEKGLAPDIDISYQRIGVPNQSFNLLTAGRSTWCPADRIRAYRRGIGMR